jgi:acyl-CoA thioesterase-1
MTIMFRKILVVTSAALSAACQSAPDRREAGGGATKGVGDDDRPVVLFVGTSLTAGFGLDETEAYPAWIQRWIDSLELGYRVVNAGVSGETSAGGLRRIDWLLDRPVAVLVVELGANDALRGLGTRALQRNLEELVARARDRHPGVAVVVAGMEAPPNLGDDYTEAFRTVFEDVARANDAVLIPFLLEGVAGDPTLNQADGIHPTARGQRIIAETMWRTLRPLLSAGGLDPSS